MVKGLLVLHSSISNGRDLWWPLDPKGRSGYNVFRADDVPTNWRKLNSTPIPGRYYRDQTTLCPTKFTVTASDWIDNGGMGQHCFRLPDIPYSSINKGRPTVATSPSDVSVEITYTVDTTITKVTVRPSIVSGIDQTVWLSDDVALPVGGAVSDFPVINYSNVTSVVATYNTLTNFVDISLNLSRVYYTVVPVMDNGYEEHLPGAFGTEVVNTLEVDKMDYIMKEAVRRNSWIFEQTGEPAYLMMRRWAGKRCGCTQGQDFAQGRTACPSCFETGIVGGYYGPFDFLFIDPDVSATREISEGGIKVTRSSQSYLGPTPIIQDGDMIIRHNGERLVISGVVYKMPRGVLVQQQFNVGVLNPLDTRYLIPINEPANPLIYNPVSQTHIPGDGAEPVFDPKTVPGKHWENQANPNTGRTITFGRIQA